MMRKLGFLVLCVPLLMGNACTDIPILNGQSVVKTVGISKETAKALTVTHQTYNGVSRLILQAVNSGKLHGNTAALVQIYYNKAGDALDVADRAYNAANETDVQHALLDANTAIRDALKLTGG